MPAETTRTLELPVGVAGPYALRRDRCVVEVAVRPFGVRLFRARLRARSGELVVTGSEASMRIELHARPIRIIPLGAVLLRAVARRGRLTFTAVDVDLSTGSSSTRIEGEVAGYGAAGEPWALPLTARVVASDETSVVLAARGPIRPPATVRGVGRWLWLDAAVEFSR